MKYYFILFFSFFCLTNSFCQNDSTLFEYDNGKKRSATIVQRQVIDSVTIFEKVVLDGFDSKIPFYHYINQRSNKGNYVFLLHGLGDSKDDWVYPSEPYLEWSRNTRAIKDSLVDLGYNLIIPDAKFHGERSYEIGFRAPQTLPPLISKNEKDSKSFELLITSSIKDLRIIMDYVENREDTLSNSFGVIGYSLGGNLGILLGIFDERITSVVGCVPPINLPARGLEMFQWSDDVINGQLNITPMTYANLLRKPTLMLMGKNDFFSLEEEVSEFYEKVSAKDKSLKYFDSGHILPNEYKTDAIKWITQFNN